MKLKSKLLAILFAVAAIGFTSCNDDDNNGPQNPQQFAFADAIFATQTNESTLNALDMTMSVSYTDNKDIVLPVTSLYSQNMMNRLTVIPGNYKMVITADVKPDAVFDSESVDLQLDVVYFAQLYDTDEEIITSVYNTQTAFDFKGYKVDQLDSFVAKHFPIELSLSYHYTDGTYTITTSTPLK